MVLSSNELHDSWFHVQVLDTRTAEVMVVESADVPGSFWFWQSGANSEWG